jgi:hypothetical protein
MPRLLQNLYWGPLERLATWLRGEPRGIRPRMSCNGRQARRASGRAVDETFGTGSRDDQIKHFLDVAAMAENDRDAERMRRFSYKLFHLGLYDRAWELRTGAAGLTQQDSFPQWDGGDLTGRSILIRSAPKDRIGGIGDELRLARFIAPVAQRARRCIVLAEPRLVPILRRSFPEVDVRVRGVDDAAALAEVNVVAYYETIALHYAKTAEEMRCSFVPLRPDPLRVASIRQRYGRVSPGPLIGISWWSSNEKKDIPDLASWAPLLRRNTANLVSLQYGDIADDVKLLEGLAGCRIICDNQIDQLVDLDGFAAQIAALDAVVSISNSTIDMAGMLGVSTVHIRDDKSSVSWPPSGPSPWYPEMIFVYKQCRPWREVFAEASARLEQMISTPGR